jgi:cytochrome c oxidase cbb3-type subunit 4
MYKEVLRSIDNIAIWPVISFVIFFLFFLGLLWWTFSVDKKFIARMSNMPMDDDHDLKFPESQTEKV